MVNASLVLSPRGQQLLERRDSPRVAVGLPVRLNLCRGFGSIMGRTCDVGLGGICVETASGIALSEIVSLELEHDGEIIKLRVQGRWQRFAKLEDRWHTGLQCVEVDADQRSQLSRIVRESESQLLSYLRTESALAEFMTFDELSDVAQCTRLRHATAGHYIWRGGRMREDENSRDSLFILRSGTVLVRPDGARASQVCLDQIREGEIFGGVGLLSALDTPMCAVAGTDSVLLEIDAGSFGYLERSRPCTAERLRELIVDRLVRQVSESVVHLAGH